MKREPLREPVPVLLREPVSVPLQEPVPVLLQEPVPVLLQEPVPVLLQEPVPVLLQEPVPVLLQEPVPVLLQEPLRPHLPPFSLSCGKHAGARAVLHRDAFSQPALPGTSPVQRRSSRDRPPASSAST
jgi:hypothetical protein